MTPSQIEAALDLLHEIMDKGFRSGERYVDADDLAFVFGRPFTFIDEDGTGRTFDGSGHWLHDYPHRQNEIGTALQRLRNLGWPSEPGEPERARA